MKISIIIPSYAEKEENLNRTLDSIYENATGEFEVLVGIHGQPSTKVNPRPNLRIIQFSKNIGIKGMINLLALLANGEYLFKLDAHCRVGKGFDTILLADMQDDWIVMPRFKIIKNDWSIQERDGQEEFYDYFYLCCPFTDPRGFRFKAGGHWKERTIERNPDLMVYEKRISEDQVDDNDFSIDETPQIHGSAWFVNCDYFLNVLGGFPNIDPTGHGQEPIWLALKNWLIGGKVMVNKKTWYAHLHQDNSVKGFHYTKEEEKHTYEITAKYWMNNKEPNLLHPIEWFIEKFYPMPTWPENWRQLLEDWRKNE